MIQVVILAAGQGKRMQSSLPKVLHQIAGKAIIEHVISTANKFTAKPIIVYGHQGKVLQDMLSHHPIVWVEQKEQQGTAHALMQALPYLEENSKALVLCGDVPLIQAHTLKRLINNASENALAMLTAKLNQPFGYGRIVREDGRVIKIIEEKDADENEKRIQEINPGIYLIPVQILKKFLPTISNHNVQQEFYLTDLIAKAVQHGIDIHTEQPTEIEEIYGVNDRAQLGQLERYHQRKLAHNLMQTGVTIMDPARLDIRGEVVIGRDVLIDVNVLLEGRVVIGNGCTIGANTVLKNTVLANNVEIKPFSLLDGVEIGSECVIGPFARLRPGTILSSNVHVGNFVEVKNSMVAEATKINHLSYIGDSQIGRNVNIGAGTITCNYDGANKHKTIIGDYTHIGSDTQLVAPVTVGEGATIAAGSTITKDVPPHKLTLTHKLEQRTLHDWQRPEKTRK